MSATSPLDPDQLPEKLDTTFHEGYVIHQQSWARWLGVRATEKWVRGKDLGEGGYGTVHLERNASTCQYRAVKKLYKRGSKFDVKRELRILLALRAHPLFFVQFLCWYENNDSIFLAMEYVEHGDLRKFLNEFGPQSEESAKEITTQVLEGLVTLHKSEICYRDLKPENILVASKSPIKLKLADFGISKCTTDTHLKTKCGTDLYLAPELKGFLPRGREYTNAVDIWALGYLIHEILTLKVPFSVIDSVSDTIQESGLSIHTGVAETDNRALLDFCRGTIDFPTEALQKSLVSGSGIDFVKRLLIADPSFRISAPDALLSEWLLGLPYPSSKEISRSNDQLKQDVDSKVLQRQFLGVGVGISLRTIDILMMHSTKGAAVDVTRLLPSSATKITEILQHAVSKGYFLLLRILLESQTISVGFWRAQNSTLLTAAAAGGHLDIVKLFLEKGASVNKSSRSQTALQAAAGGGYLDIVKLLLEKGADINISPGGQGALRAAAGGGHLDIVKLLLEKGVNVDAAPSWGQTALRAAAGGGHLDIVKLLLEKGVNVNAAPSWGQTALRAAAGGGHLDIVKLLLEKGADINTSPGGQVALRAAVGGGHLDIVKLLLEKGVNVNAASSWGQTALQEAACGGHLDIVKLLLEKGANVNAAPLWGQTALQAARHNGHLEIARLLLIKRSR